MDSGLLGYDTVSSSEWFSHCSKEGTAFEQSRIHSAVSDKNGILEKTAVRTSNLERIQILLRLSTTHERV
jgi:hypothetical protein